MRNAVKYRMRLQLSMQLVKVSKKFKRVPIFRLIYNCGGGCKCVVKGLTYESRFNTLLKKNAGCVKNFRFTFQVLLFYFHILAPSHRASHFCHFEGIALLQYLLKSSNYTSG